MKITIEKPRLSLPFSLIVDDPAPCINTLYYYRLQVSQKEYEFHEPRIPVDFLERFIAVAQERDLRGKFTVLPYPAGLGSILDGWEGCDLAELRRWLDLARTRLPERFDITPEILTHTLALDLSTHQLIPEAEHLWMDRRNAQELTAYMGAACAILKEAGFQPTGITQPVTFTGDRSAYSQAVLDSIRQSGGPPVTFQYIDAHSGGAPYPPPKLVLQEPSHHAAVVDIINPTPWDLYWQTMRPEGYTPEQCTEFLITADGTSGLLVDIAQTGGWGVYTTHWQSLYSDGSHQGLAALDLTAARLRQAFGDRLLWLKLGDVARYAAASSAYEQEIIPTPDGWSVKLSSPFDCSDFTLSLQDAQLSSHSVESVWQVSDPSAPAILIKPNLQGKGLMDAHSWQQEGEKLTLCLDLPPGETLLHLKSRP